MLPGRGETVGAALVGDARVHGVLFTGSTDVARSLIEKTRGDLAVARVSQDLHDALDRHRREVLEKED